MRAIHWIPTSQDLDGFQKSFLPCDLDLSIRRVNLRLTGPPTFNYIEAYLVDQDEMTFSPLWMQIAMAKWVGTQTGVVIYISSSVISFTVTY